MTTFTRNWNAAYETSPGDTQDISQGALRIRELKTDIRERIAIDHIYADGVAAPNSEDGFHLKSTYKKGSDPSVPADYGVVYVKDHNNGSNTEPELHFRDDTGNILRLTERGSYPLFLTTNVWPRAQKVQEVNLGTGSGSIAMDANVSNAFGRGISGTSDLDVPSNGTPGQILTLRTVQSGGPHTITVTGQGLRGSPDLDYASAFPGETLFVFYCGDSNIWRIVAIHRNFSSVV